MRAVQFGLDKAEIRTVAVAREFSRASAGLHIARNQEARYSLTYPIGSIRLAEKFRYLKAHPGFGGLVVSAMGMRAAESPTRSKRAPWRRNSRNSKAGREWFDWLPIHALETPDVFRIVREAGQAPHWAYAAGMSRVRCSFCILASRADLRRAAELRPDLYARCAALEQRIDHTLSPSRITLPQLTGTVGQCMVGNAN